MSRPGGVGVHGRGVLRGWLYVHDQRIILVTANPGTRNAVCFVTDLHEHGPLPADGARVAVAGVIRKLSPTSGTITRAHLVDWPELHHMPGQYVVLTGHVETRMIYGLGGEAPPSGSWLVLPRPIELGKLRTREVYLATGRYFPQGYRTELHGRIAVRHYGDVETPMQLYATLTGVSDLFAGEPLYRGNAFYSATDGAPLCTLVLERHEVSFESPSLVLVLEPEQQRAYAGTVGESHPPHESPFHGFYGQAPLRKATDIDRAAIRYGKRGCCYSTTTGKQLRAVGHEGPDEAYPDALYTCYLLDEDTYTVYEVLTGGVAGYSHEVAWVIHVPKATATFEDGDTD